jgi:hypothetical protein
VAASALAVEKTKSTGGATTSALAPLAGLIVTITLSTTK